MPEIERGALAAQFAVEDPEARVRAPTTPLAGYRIIAASIRADSPARGRRIDELELPTGSLLVAVTEHGQIVPPCNNMQLYPGDELIVLAPAASEESDGDASERTA
jgi:Trk K+ transport system NAD-binding subunit